LLAAAGLIKREAPPWRGPPPRGGGVNGNLGGVTNIFIPFLESLN